MQTDPETPYSTRKKKCSKRKVKQDSKTKMVLTSRRMTKGHRRFPLRRAINKVVSDYNSKYKINTEESILAYN